MFDIANLKAKDTFELSLRHPVTDELLYADEDKKLPLKAILFSTSSKQYRTAMNAMQNRRLKRKKDATAEVLQEEGVELLVACSDKILNMTFEGEAVDNPAAFRALYSETGFEWLRQQVDSALGDVSNFIQA